MKKFDKDRDFDRAQAQTQINKFFSQLPQLTESATLLQSSQIGNLNLGGNHNGTRVDYTTHNAKNQAKLEGQNRYTYIRRSEHPLTFKPYLEVTTPLTDIYKSQTTLKKLQATEKLNDFAAKTVINLLKPELNLQDPDIADWLDRNKRIRTQNRNFADELAGLNIDIEKKASGSEQMPYPLSSGQAGLKYTGRKPV